MSEIIERSNQHHVRTKSEDGKFYAQTVFYDDKSLEQNNKIRLSGMLEKSRLGLHENEDVRCVVSCPSTLQWTIFKKKFPEVYKLITSKYEHERMKGVAQLEIVHPDWVVYARK